MKNANFDDRQWRKLFVFVVKRVFFVLSKGEKIMEREKNNVGH